MKTNFMNESYKIILDNNVVAALSSISDLYKLHFQKESQSKVNHEFVVKHFTTLMDKFKMIFKNLISYERFFETLAMGHHDFSISYFFFIYDYCKSIKSKNIGDIAHDFICEIKNAEHASYSSKIYKSMIYVLSKDNSYKTSIFESIVNTNNAHSIVDLCRNISPKKDLLDGFNKLLDIQNQKNVNLIFYMIVQGSSRSVLDLLSLISGEYDKTNEKDPTKDDMQCYKGLKELFNRKILNDHLLKKFFLLFCNQNYIDNYNASHDDKSSISLKYLFNKFFDILLKKYNECSLWNIINKNLDNQKFINFFDDIGGLKRVFQEFFMEKELDFSKKFYKSKHGLQKTEEKFPKLIENNYKSAIKSKDELLPIFFREMSGDKLYNFIYCIYSDMNDKDIALESFLIDEISDKSMMEYIALYLKPREIIKFLARIKEEDIIASIKQLTSITDLNKRNFFEYFVENRQVKDLISLFKKIDNCYPRIKRKVLDLNKQNTYSIQKEEVKEKIEEDKLENYSIKDDDSDMITSSEYSVINNICNNIQNSSNTNNSFDLAFTKSIEESIYFEKGKFCNTLVILGGYKIDLTYIIENLITSKIIDLLYKIGKKNLLNGFDLLLKQINICGEDKNFLELLVGNNLFAKEHLYNALTSKISSINKESEFSHLNYSILESKIKHMSFVNDLLGSINILFEFFIDFKFGLDKKILFDIRNDHNQENSLLFYILRYGSSKLVTSFILIINYILDIKDITEKKLPEPDKLISAKIFFDNIKYISNMNSQILNNLIHNLSEKKLLTILNDVSFYYDGNKTDENNRKIYFIKTIIDFNVKIKETNSNLLELFFNKNKELFTKILDQIGINNYTASIYDLHYMNALKNIVSSLWSSVHYNVLVDLLIDNNYQMISNIIDYTDNKLSAKNCNKEILDDLSQIFIELNLFNNKKLCASNNFNIWNFIIESKISYSKKMQLIVNILMQKDLIDEYQEKALNQDVNKNKDDKIKASQENNSNDIECEEEFNKIDNNYIGIFFKNLNLLLSSCDKEIVKIIMTKNRDYITKFLPQYIESEYADKNKEDINTDENKAFNKCMIHQKLEEFYEDIDFNIKGQTNEIIGENIEYSESS